MLLPLGQRTKRYRHVVAAYLFGTVTGATLTGLVAWVVSGFFEPLPPTVRVGVLVGAALIVWSIKIGLLAGHVRLPETRRQIPFEVFGQSVTRGAWRFGFELGTGVRTYVPTAGPYVLLVALVLALPTFGQALLVALGFGFGRAVPLMVSVAPATRIAMTNDFLRGVDHRFSQTACSLIVLSGALLLV